MNLDSVDTQICIFQESEDLPAVNKIRGKCSQLSRPSPESEIASKSNIPASLSRESADALSFQYPESSIPNFTAHVMPSNQSSSRTQSKSRNTLNDSTEKTTTSKTKKTSPYDPNFEQNLIDNGIYPDDYDFPDDRDPPRSNNENEILSRLGQPRSSLSSSQFFNKEFRKFKQTNSRALNEDAVMGDVFPVIQGTARISSAKNLVFENLEPLTDGNLIDAKVYAGKPVMDGMDDDVVYRKEVDDSPEGWRMSHLLFLSKKMMRSADIIYIF